MTTYGLDVPAFRSTDSRDFYRRFVDAAEAAGFTNLWVGDHLLWHRPRFEAFTLLGMLSGLTPLTLGTGIALGALRPPWWLAKSAATLHEMSDGGFVLGLGAGGEYQREFEVAGVEVSKRGAALDEAIRYCRNAWSGALGNDFSPTPSTAIPIWLGGRKQVALRRVARSADGWLGLFLTRDKFADALRYLGAECQSHGRPNVTAAIALWTCVNTNSDTAKRLALETISTEYQMPSATFARYVVAGTPNEVTAIVASYADAGADHVEIHIAHPDPLSQIATWESELIPRLVG